MCLSEMFRVGQRIRTNDDGKYLGTVRYVGSVAGSEGEWVGVEWDDSSRGKHDGTAGGQRYFQASQAGGASFVRSHKIDAGISLLDALRKKYCCISTSEEAEEQDDDTDMHIISVRQTRVPVVLVGRDKVKRHYQDQLHKLRVAVLQNVGVSSAGLPGQVGAAAGCIEELYLSENLLSDWSTVGRIHDELPFLRLLDLSANRIEALDELSDRLPSSLSQLKKVTLNKCGLTWQNVEVIERMLPNVEELQLDENELSSLSGRSREGDMRPKGGYVEGFCSLRVLSLEGNHINDWQEVMRLSRLPNLETLCLSGNHIKSISHYKDDGDLLDGDLTAGVTPFAMLKSLWLGDNDISEWGSIDACDRFPKLEDVRLSGNPIMGSPIDGGSPRYVIVARIGRITALNASPIRPRERNDAEMRYLRHIMSQQSGRSDDDIMQQHPRFLYLRDLYRLAEVPSVLSQSDTGGFGRNMFSISLVCVSANSGERPPITKKVPGSTTVGKLKLLCERLFKIKAPTQRLFIKDAENPIPIPLDTDDETVGGMGLSAGSTILVDEICRESVLEAEAMVKLEQERRLQEQLQQADFLRRKQEEALQSGKVWLAGSA